MLPCFITLRLRWGWLIPAESARAMQEAKQLSSERRNASLDCLHCSACTVLRRHPFIPIDCHPSPGWAAPKLSSAFPSPIKPFSRLSMTTMGTFDCYRGINHGWINQPPRVCDSVGRLPKAAERGDEPPRFYEWSAHAFNNSDFCEDELLSIRYLSWTVSLVRMNSHVGN